MPQQRQARRVTHLFSLAALCESKGLRSWFTLAPFRDVRLRCGDRATGDRSSTPAGLDGRPCPRRGTAAERAPAVMTGYPGWPRVALHS